METKSTFITRAMDTYAARRANLKNADRGFSLIELLVVVLILGVLAAIAIPVYLGQVDKANENAAKAAAATAKATYAAKLFENELADSGNKKSASEIAGSAATASSKDDIKVGPTTQNGAAVTTTTSADSIEFCAQKGNGKTFSSANIPAGQCVVS